MKHRKLIGLMAGFISILPFQAALATTGMISTCAGYADVASDYKYCQAIQYVTDQDIFSGSYSIETHTSGEKMFKPEDKINRAEVLKVILRAKGDATAYDQIKTLGSEVGFKDISATAADWWLGFLKAAKNDGIISGYGDKTFRATNPVSRVEFLKMMLEASPSAESVHNWNIQASIELWADTPITAWYAKYIAFANHYGLFANLTGCTSGSICPDKSLTRGEAAQMIYNYKNSLHMDLGIKAPRG